ncbi:IDEAL domain-containing protein [Cytobacillus gottheilii]|uniref:IDEAL domain-containing protein n=1 Tax=Cytobacillus gottheilii TaxID=859144 RepID=UPI000834D40A|nr:IDEAL domain-containing protein [Cytobacillus gottheilii]
MEKHTLYSPHQSEENMVSHLAEKVLNEALLTYKIQKLRNEIDKTLEIRDQALFMKLTEELNDLTEQLN